MLLTITTTHRPATDLGHLLRKRPGRTQTFDLPFGTATVLYTEVGDERCTAALLVDVDPVALVHRDVRVPRGDHHVNDRPYAASAFLSVAIAAVYRSALSGRESGDRPGLAERALPLEAYLPVVPSPFGEGLLRRLFEPLGYVVEARGHALDEELPELGESPYFALTLRGELTLSALLTHLYVLLPVLDGAKHYWVGSDEVDKLLRRGEGWLAAHPERDLIVRRYLRRDRSLVDAALARLLEEAREDDPEDTADEEEQAAVERPISLADARVGAVLAVLRARGARRVVDLGCGEGRLLRELARDRAFTEILGVDVDHRALATAARKLRLERRPESERDRIRLLQTALTYRDGRLHGFDAAVAVEVIEHLDPPRLDAFARVVLGEARPSTLVVTTPNREFNVRFDGLPAGTLRHRDHRFEWTRDEFAVWAGEAAERHGYAVRFLPVGPVDPTLGPPTQMAVFET